MPRNYDSGQTAFQSTEHALAATKFSSQEIEGKPSRVLGLKKKKKTVIEAKSSFPNYLVLCYNLRNRFWEHPLAHNTSIEAAL